jgi:hypothetical protein
MKITASVDNPSPKYAADKITDKGPKKTNAKVAIASASHALVLTIKKIPQVFQYKQLDYYSIMKLTKILGSKGVFL